jgi:sugar/nucleoside kinase (ribokinase family)
MAPETEPLDVLTIGEMVVDFISVEKTDTLSNASTFRRYLGGSPANIAVYVSKLRGTSALVAKPPIEDARRLFDVNMDQETLEETAISEFHYLGAKIVILTRSGGVVTVSDNTKLSVEGQVERMIDRQNLYAGLKSGGLQAV